MTNEERNTALYQKMFAEQEKFRDWLKGQPPEEVLNHAYEYTIREDILLSLEYHDLSDAQADALMKSPSPLADVFRDFEKRETDDLGLSGIQSGYASERTAPCAQRNVRVSLSCQLRSGTRRAGTVPGIQQSKYCLQGSY